VNGFRPTFTGETSCWGAYKPRNLSRGKWYIGDDKGHLTERKRYHLLFSINYDNIKESQSKPYKSNWKYVVTGFTYFDCVLDKLDKNS
jgi:hypothetical protein